jgi:hypothetical protein
MTGGEQVPQLLALHRCDMPLVLPASAACSLFSWHSPISCCLMCCVLCSYLAWAETSREIGLLMGSTRPKPAMTLDDGWLICLLLQVALHCTGE